MALSPGFSGAYAGRRVLVTGHTGFKGSWLCAWLGRLGARVTGLALAPDTEPSHWRLLGLQDVDSRLVDLRDAQAVASAIGQARPDVIFHLAAQPLVRRGYREPAATFATNVMGLVHLFEAVRTSGLSPVIVNATTDKVYRMPMPGRPFRESDPLGGHDPYSASKACAEIVSECWRSSWLRDRGARLATARAGNVIGGGDWAEDRLVPDLVRAAVAGRAIALRNPGATRPWQHVLEPLSGYLRLGELLLAGRDLDTAWNFGPDESQQWSVRDMVERFARLWPGTEWTQDGASHPHESAELALDSREAIRSLGWRPVWDAQTAIERTVAWYRSWHEGGSLATAGDIDEYTRAARAIGVDWAR